MSSGIRYTESIFTNHISKVEKHTNGERKTKDCKHKQQSLYVCTQIRYNKDILSRFEYLQQMFEILAIARYMSATP